MHIDKWDVHFAGNSAHQVGIFAMCVVQFAALVEPATSHRGQQYWCGLFTFHVLYETAQVTTVIVGRCVTVGFIAGLIIVAELDKDVIAGLQIIDDTAPQSFFDEGARTATIARPVFDDDGVGIEVLLKRFAPTGFRPTIGLLGRHRRIAG
jgi:hypothetical protein